VLFRTSATSFGACAVTALQEAASVVAHVGTLAVKSPAKSFKARLACVCVSVVARFSIVLVASLTFCRDAAPAGFAKTIFSAEAGAGRVVLINVAPKAPELASFVAASLTMAESGFALSTAAFCTN
jgi:hypothetical protein